MKTAEFRGVDSLVCARILQDDADGYQAGAVTTLAEVASIAKTTNQNSETHYYDNTGMITIKAVGADTITLIVPALVLETLAKVTGAQIDQATGAYMSGESDTNYEYALGYRIKLTDGTYRYVWRLKGTFSSIPDEQSETESESITTNNQTIIYTGTNTIYAFSNGGRKRDVVIDERDGKANVAQFFNAVLTPDTVGNIAKRDVTSLSVSPETKELPVGGTFRFSLNISPAGYLPAWNSSNPTVASIDAAGDIKALREGTTVITATAGTMAAAATLTVVAAT